jgi:hypothetical protein
VGSERSRWRRIATSPARKAGGRRPSGCRLAPALCPSRVQGSVALSGTRCRLGFVGLTNRGPNWGPNVSESEGDPEALKPHRNAESEATGPRSVWLWSRRSRVRVPSLTPQESRCKGGDFFVRRSLMLSCLSQPVASTWHQGERLLGASPSDRFGLPTSSQGGIRARSRYDSHHQ